MLPLFMVLHGRVKLLFLVRFTLVALTSVHVCEGEALGLLGGGERVAGCKRRAQDH